MSVLEHRAWNLQEAKQWEVFFMKAERDKSLAVSGEDVEFRTNSYLAPGYNLVKLAHELKEEANGTGTLIEQTYHYVIDQGALGWLKISDQEDFVASRNSLPMDQVADGILYRLKKSSFRQDCLDILALGSGRARDEFRLAQFLLKHTPIQHIRIFLLDISPFLLSEAYQRAQESFGRDERVQVIGVHGNFHHLQRYQELLSISERSNRMLLVTMLGGTWGNLENELLLLRSGLRALPPQTIFFMDVVERFGLLHNADSIQRDDPWLSGASKWLEDSKDFLIAPLLFYREGLRKEDVDWKFVLDGFNPHVLNSYLIEIRVHFQPNIQFAVQKVKRYQQEGLRDAFDREQWGLFRTFSFNPNMRAYLFQKRS